MRSMEWLRVSWHLVLLLVAVSCMGMMAATAVAQETTRVHISPYMVETNGDSAVAAEWIDLVVPENRTAIATTAPSLIDEQVITQSAVLTSTVALTEAVTVTETASVSGTVGGISVDGVNGVAADGVAVDGTLALTGAASLSAITSTASTTATLATIAADASNDIIVPFLRFRTNATNPTAPVFLLIGKNQSSLEPLTQVDQALPLIALMVNASDVIVVGQRGMESGQPFLECAGDFSLPLGEAADLDMLSADLGRYYARCADFWREAGSDLAGYNVREIAADVNQVREALGYQKIRLVGSDLGAQVGLEYIRDYDDTVDRAVFALIMGPNQAMKLPSDLQTQLEKLDQVVRADPQLTAYVPDFLGLVSRVLARLEDQSVTVDVVDPVTGEVVSVAAGQRDLQYATAMALGGAQQWALPAHYFDMDNGDFTWLAEQTLAWRNGAELSLAPALIKCTSGATAERRARVEAEASTSLLGNTANGVSFDICDSIAVAGDVTLDVTDEYRSLVVSDVPTLLISGGMDGHTPAANGDAVLAGLVNGQHVVVTCGTHDLFEEALPDLVPLLREFMRGDPLMPLATSPAALSCDLEPVTAAPVPEIGWTGAYFNNRSLQNDPTLVRVDPAIDFNWGEGSPAPGINANNFSVQWTSTVDLPAGTYRFSIWVDDGARLWVDDVLVLDAWTEGPARSYIVDVNVVRGLHNLRMDYFESEARALARLAVSRLDYYPDWRADYFDNTDLSGLPVVSRNEESINYVWGSTPPVPGLSGAGYSVRWERRQFLPAGDYEFELDVSGGARLWVDGVLLIDGWTEISERSLTANSQFMTPGVHDIRVEYVYLRGNAAIRFAWSQAPAIAPPTALINGPSRTQINVQTTYDGSGSTTADGTPPVGYAWEMGDGTTANGSTVTHVFGSAGVYNVTLTVTDALGQTGRNTLQVKVDPAEVAPPDAAVPAAPPVAVIRSPDQGLVGQKITFDARASVSANPITRFDWQFGDGTGANAVIVDKIYGAAGIYSVDLTLTDDQGVQGSTSKYVQIFAATPVATGPVTPTPVPPASVPLQPASPLPTPQIAVPTLTPIPEQANNVQPESPLPTPVPNFYVPPTAEIAAIVDNNPLVQVPDESGRPSVRAPLGKTITFDATRSIGGSEPIQSYYWDFGNGQTRSEDKVGVQYAEPGTYQVVLVVLDVGGQSVETTLVVTVEGS